MNSGTKFGINGININGIKWTWLISRMMVAIATVILSLGIVATPVAAASPTANPSPTGSLSPTANQSNQDMNRPAQLIAPEPEGQINLYSQPDTRKQRVGYALGGDRATVLRQVGSNEGKTWNYVRMDKQPPTEGWVQEDFVALQQPPSDQQTKQSPSPWSQVVKSIQSFSNPQQQSGQNSGKQQSQGFSQSGVSQNGASQQQVNQPVKSYQQTPQSKTFQQK